jgi:hypothetical protein
MFVRQVIDDVALFVNLAALDPRRLARMFPSSLSTYDQTLMHLPIADVNSGRSFIA